MLVEVAYDPTRLAFVVGEGFLDEPFEIDNVVAGRLGAMRGAVVEVSPDAIMHALDRRPIRPLGDGTWMDPVDDPPAGGLPYFLLPSGVPSDIRDMEADAWSAWNSDRGERDPDDPREEEDEDWGEQEDDVDTL